MERDIYDIKYNHVTSVAVKLKYIFLKKAPSSKLNI